MVEELLLEEDELDSDDELLLFDEDELPLFDEEELLLVELADEFEDRLSVR